MKKLVAVLISSLGLMASQAHADAQVGTLGSGSTIATATTVVVGTIVVGTIASGLDDNTGTTGTVTAN